VKSSIRKAEELGAKVIIPPNTLPEGDEMAVLHDPFGLSFAVWHSAKS
jgi:predicted enzyme related to lactoylglutathione lyase